MTLAPSAARLLVIDDHELFSAALTAALMRRWPGMEVLAARTGQDGMLAAQRGGFDLVLCDVSLPDLDGREVLRAILRSSPTTRVCMLSARTEHAVMVDAIESGACGYLSKSIDLEEFTSKVERALAGDQVYDDASASSIISTLAAQDTARALTAREKDILLGLARGETYQELAEHMFVSTNTLKKNVQSLYRKLGVSDRASAVAKGFKEGTLG